jgi:hypothetical protein
VARKPDIKFSDYMPLSWTAVANVAGAVERMYECPFLEGTRKMAHEKRTNTSHASRRTTNYDDKEPPITNATTDHRRTQTW